MLNKTQEAGGWTNCPAEEKDKYRKGKERGQLLSRRRLVLAASTFAVLTVWSVGLVAWYPESSNKNEARAVCSLGLFVYVVELPGEFNVGLLERCKELNVYTDMCPHVANRGLGQPIPSVGGVASEGSWFATHQFIAEMLFHARVEGHPCRTRDPSLADLFYVPFYGGLHASSVFREANLTERDALPLRLSRHLTGLPGWARRGGRDHFLALGRTAWDFLRGPPGQPDFGANALLALPAVRNMSVLTVERQPWERGLRQHGIPYPSYFHPRGAAEMGAWQEEVGRRMRPHLFSFVGGARRGLAKAAVREGLIRQCRGSPRCRLLLCGPGEGACHSPGSVMEVMRASSFCLQAPGDSFTRRSTFDSMLAGCIPVFFSEHTAYTQYAWYLPEDPAAYSVFLNNASATHVEAHLASIPAHRVDQMRARVVDLIPTLTYSHPNATLPFPDAVDVALASLVANHRGTG